MAKSSVNRLDFDKGYVEVHGLPGARYQQDGRMFRSDGSEAINTQPYLDDTPIAVEEIIPINPLGNTNIEPEDRNAEYLDVSGKNFGGMHWKHLKALVETYGGEWTNKQDALAFLKGKS